MFFGATVTYTYEAGQEETVTIFDTHEAVTGLGQVSWVSPVARALLKARVGDEVALSTPDGTKIIEVRKVEYPTSSSKLL